MCWWKHVDIQDSAVDCYICSKRFESKSKMMLHRKIDHSNHVRTCQSFLENNCRFQNNTCWFSHPEEQMETDEFDEKDDQENKEDGEESISVFQKVNRKEKPPIRGQKSKQKMD